MSKNQLLILDDEQIADKIVRIAFQIYEDNFDERELVLAGIADRGYVLAHRIQMEIERISKMRITLIKVSLDKDSSQLQASTDKDISIAKNKVVVLIDDVLNSGRTMAYAFGVFINVPLKKIRTCVLVDRSHHRYPIVSDFTGMKLSTVLNDEVKVELNTKDAKKDKAYLI